MIVGLALHHWMKCCPLQPTLERLAGWLTDWLSVWSTTYHTARDRLLSLVILLCCMFFCLLQSHLRLISHAFLHPQLTIDNQFKLLYFFFVFFLIDNLCHNRHDYEVVLEVFIVVPILFRRQVYCGIPPDTYHVGYYWWNWQTMSKLEDLCSENLQMLYGNLCH